MAKRPRPTLADQVEAAERRSAPRDRARAVGSGAWWSLWLGLAVLFVVLLAGAVAFLRYRGLILT